MALYALAAGSFVLDRIFKMLVLSAGPLGWPGVAEFTLFRNRGIAFSLPLPDAVFWPLALAILGLLIWGLFRVRRDPRRALPPLFALIILGAVSNLLDRLAFGATIDYFLFFNLSAVNVADGMIVGGAAAAYWLLRPGTGRTK